jgi:steroid delta-isomerase-like uncharacterized protein
LIALGEDIMDPNVLERAKEALETTDVEAILMCYGDQFVFEDTASGEIITQHDQLRNYFERLFGLPGVGFSEISYYECSERALIEWIWSGENPTTGKTYRIKGVSVIQLRGDRIFNETLYYDPRPAV